MFISNPNLVLAGENPDEVGGFYTLLVAYWIQCVVTKSSTWIRGIGAISHCWSKAEFAWPQQAQFCYRAQKRCRCEHVQKIAVLEHRCLPNIDSLLRETYQQLGD